VYYSTAVDRLVHDGDLVADGMWRNAAAYHGVRSVNGVFKGVSVDAIAPSLSLPYGWIRSETPVQQTAATLAMLGLRYVVALDDEAVSPELHAIGIFSAGSRRLRLFELPDVSGAFVLPRAAVDVVLPVLPGCRHAALLCRDATPLWSQRTGAATAHRGAQADTIVVDVTSPASGRTVVVSEMYRDGWVASSRGRDLPVRSVLGGLIGIDTSEGGASRIELQYRPWTRIAVSVAAAAALAVGLLLLLR
jgi:hypothetical protein